MNAARLDATESFSRAALVPIQPEDCGKYQLVAKLGSGGMAEVFLAIVSGLSGFRKIVVVKRLHPHLMEEPEFVTMFLDEARLAARLNHPNIVQTYEVGEVSATPFLAMEHLEGQPLGKILRRAKRSGSSLPVTLALDVAIGALKGLHYAHELHDLDGAPLGVVHRDVSPSNIFVTYHGDVKILDFGIAKAATKISVTRAGVVKGKFAYMSPEQARAGEVDRRSDLWSMGVCLYQAVTGRRVFPGKSEVDLLEQVLTGDVTAPLRALEGQPAPLRAALEKALSARPEDRFQTAEEMRRALQEVRAGLIQQGPELSDYVDDLFKDSVAGYREATRLLLKGGVLPGAEDLPGTFGHRLNSEHPTPTGRGPHGDKTPTARSRSHVTRHRQPPPPGRAEWLRWLLFVAVLILTGLGSYFLFRPATGSPHGNSPGHVETAD